MDKSFYQIIAILARKNQVYMSNVLEEYDITIAELPFFMALIDHQGLTQEELTTIVCVDKAATARAVKSLEQKGYLKRVKDKEDSRQNRVYPTKEAKLLKETIKSEILSFNNQLTQGIDTQILELIYDGLQKMEENIMGLTSGPDTIEMTKDVLSGRRTGMEEWPVKLWNIQEIPVIFLEQVLRWIEKDFSEYEFIYVPRQYTKPDSYAYLFGYGENKILFLKEIVEREGKKGDEKRRIEKMELNRQQITEVITSKELLLAKLVVHYQKEKEQKSIEFPYIATTYYLYNPFLNWLLGLEKDFQPGLLESKHPRPASLYDESLAMYNYALDAYRLGEGFQNYTYKVELYTPKGKDTKQQQKEWLKVHMEKGEFEVYRFGYLTECRYRLAGV